ncbi:MAG: DUF4292 domain-containing protein [Bacteroidales bacterium]
MGFKFVFNHVLKADLRRLLVSVIYPVRNNFSATLILFLLSIPVFYSCKTHRKIVKEPIKEYGADYLFTKLKENEFRYEWFSSRFNLDLTIDKKKNSLSGQIRMKKDSALWVTLSPALGVEMARVLLTQDSVKFFNRINNTYFTGDWAMVNHMLQMNIDFDIIQALLMGIDLTFYEDGKFRASYDSKEYNLVTSGRGKLKKYVKNHEDDERIYIQNIYLNPESFKITSMKIKEIKKDNKKLDAIYSNFRHVNDQLFPHRVTYDITADFPIRVDMTYSRISSGGELSFPFNIPTKYAPLQ